jgi:DNA-binding response OmpR family regulator
MTVLVVEDDPDVRDLVALSLKHAGYDVLAQSNGESALAVALGEQPDLVILDWMMPGMSGVEVCRKLRADPRGAHIRVLLLTSRAQEMDIDLGFDAGANDYMVKPFRGRELVSRVDSLVQATRQRTAPPGHAGLLT